MTGSNVSGPVPRDREVDLSRVVGQHCLGEAAIANVAGSRLVTTEGIDPFLNAAVDVGDADIASVFGVA